MNTKDKIVKKGSKLLKVVTALTMTLSLVHVGVKANGSVNVNVNNDSISIGNEYIERQLTITDGKIQTNKIINKLNNKEITFGNNSEDFIINTLVEKDTSTETNKIDVLNEKVSASLCNVGGTCASEGQINMLFDGNKDTFIDGWTRGNPFTLTLDFGKDITLGALSVDKRPGYPLDGEWANYDTVAKNGTMGGFTLQKSSDGEVWEDIITDEFTKEDYNLHNENGMKNVGDTVYRNFDTVTARYLRLLQTSNAKIGGDQNDGIQEFTSAEISFYKNEYSVDEGEDNSKEENRILSSDLEYDSYSVDNNYVDEDNVKGKKLIINYKPYNYNDVNYTISENYILKEGKHYIQSYLEIGADDKENAKIDYIELDNIAVDSSYEGVWSKPNDSAYSTTYMEAHLMGLGQPIYMNSFFMGSEFPAAETDIVEDKTQIRYYSGKSLAQLEEEGSLVNDKFTTWNNVVGSAESTDESVEKQALFDYIEDIAVKTKFRKQYNSWFDYMYNITDENLFRSFAETDKFLAENNIEPLDSYVVDDGWNTYPWYSEGNKTGFWEFNDKFPNEFYTISNLTGKLGSEFGMWVGPQGGFQNPGAFGDWLEQNGTGYTQNITQNIFGNRAICTGSSRYIENWGNRFVDYQERFDIGYWKWDGFGMATCKNPNHDHMTGGENDMYFNTDKWENWITVFEKVRDARESHGKDLWINGTNNVHLSPWMLQWINTVWMQNTGDTLGGNNETKITERDWVYYRMIHNEELQFPLKNIYNHEPIYGSSAGSNLNTEVFREYLLSNAVRGTAFWELYFSPSIMNDEKWKVTADVLTWTEENFDVLEHALMFGGNPRQEVYGYSSWNGNEGIISFTNPTDSVQEYSIVMNDIIGVPSTVKDLTGVQVEPYQNGEIPSVTYGETLTVTIQPRETLIYQYSNEDTTGPKLVSSKIKDENTVLVKFNERINVNDSTFTINDTEVTANLLADYRTVELNTEGLEETANIVTNVKDVYRNTNELSFTANTTEVAYKERVLLDNDNMTLSDKGISGNNDFGISMALKTTDSDSVLLSQGDDITLSIDEDGYVVFDVLGQSITSKEEITTVIEKAHGIFSTPEYVPTTTEKTIIGKVNDGKIHTINATREANGNIKLYIDGNLSSSTYDETRVNDTITSQPITLGSSTFEGRLLDVTVNNEVVSYDDAKTFVEKYDVSEELKISQNTYSATSNVEEWGAGLGIEKAIDGSESTFWATKHHPEGDFVVDFTFDNVEKINKLIVTPRERIETNGNGDIKKFSLQVSTDGENYQEVVTDKVFPKDSNYHEVTFDTVEAKYVRLIIKEVYQIGRDRAAVAVEFNFYHPYPELKSFDYAIVDGKVENVYETTTAGTLLSGFNVTDNASLKMVSNGVEMNDKDVVKAGDVLEYYFDGKLVETYEVAELVKLDFEELQNLITESEKLVKSDYTSESWSKLEVALEKANNVLNGTDITQEKVDSVEVNIKEAMANLEKVVYTVTVNGEEVYKGKYNDKVTVTAPVVEGKEFTAWLYDGKVISTDATYTFFLSKDMELTPCYEAVEMNAEALLTNAMLVKRADSKADVKFVAQLIVPEGYTVKDAGLVWSSKEGVELSLENTNLKPIYITKISTTNQFSVTIKGMPAGKFIRGKIFATLVDSEGNETVVYSDEARVVNK